MEILVPMALVIAGVMHSGPSEGRARTLPDATALSLVGREGEREESSQASSELEGEWEAISSISDGRPPFALPPGLVTLSFRGGVLTATNLMPIGPDTPANKQLVLGFALEPKTLPKRLDYWQEPARKIETVYEVKGDELRIAVPESPKKCGNKRPAAVSGDKGSCAVVLVLKKRKP